MTSRAEVVGDADLSKDEPIEKELLTPLTPHNAYCPNTNPNKPSKGVTSIFLLVESVETDESGKKGLLVMVVARGG